MKMDATESLLQSFRSKKVLRSSSKSDPSPAIEVPAGDPWSSKTPEKPVNASRRIQNRNAAFSLSQVRKAAHNLLKSDPEPSAQGDPILRSDGDGVDCRPQSSAVKTKKPNRSAKLPEKYEMLAKFFKGLDSSIRLLQLKASLLSFKNIKPAVETLTDRTFTHSHVAQMKFILPEAIELTKVLLQDESTLCMKSDLVITLNPNAVVGEGKVKSGNANLELSNIFRKRLLDYLEAHPEEDDIPEGELPEPFNKSKHDTLSKAPRIVDAPNDAVSEQKHSVCSSLSKPPASASHLSQSFRPRFSRRNTLSMKEETKSDQTVSERKPYETPNSHQSECVAKPKSTSCSSHLETPIKDARPSKVEKVTPAKLVSTPAKVMTSTPALAPPPKRCYMSPEDDSAKSPNKLARRSSRGKLVFDTPVKDASSADQVSEIGTCSLDYQDLLDVLPENLLQSIREKERKATIERSPAISQAKWRKQMIASLPKMFDTIYCLFHSIQRSVITKKELMHKVLANQIDIADAREAEEQLRLLLEFAPEWIYEKMASSGDLLVCVNKMQCPSSIRARLLDAK
ncbi:unnamed protein product [Cuscuta campestris]|uniref:CDT1 Geminin-binding domain-containing protein n=1 Tax=Cuscuta campestris TaxID=132261 RepID=A0A484K228_9ASTE|nr:unnamed protein product [Cuscuta campestris]